MNVRTASDDFKNQYIDVLRDMAKEAKENEEEFDSDYVWNNRERLGELFYEAIHNYTDIENAIEVTKEKMCD